MVQAMRVITFICLILFAINGLFAGENNGGPQVEGFIGSGLLFILLTILQAKIL